MNILMIYLKKLNKMSKETLLEFRLRLNKDVPAYHLKGYEDTFLISIEVMKILSLLVLKV
jgi:hypothetical protein